MKRIKALIRRESRGRSFSFPRWIVLSFVMGICVALPYSSSIAEPVVEVLRIGFSERVFSQVNENDAAAATQVWGESIARHRDIHVKTQTHVFRDLNKLKESLAAGLTDLASMTTPEHFELESSISFDSYMTAEMIAGNINEEYVILVNRDSGTGDISGLQGRRLSFLRSPRTSLAGYWLDVHLGEHGFPEAREFFGTIQDFPKASQAVLSVFFGKADACLATRVAFEMIVELNPQVRKKVSILASSPEYLPALTCIRTNYVSSVREHVVDSLATLHENPNGNQLLMTFRSRRVLQIEESMLDSARELMRKHRNLVRGQEETVSVHGL